MRVMCGAIRVGRIECGRTQSHSDQIALGGLEKKTIFQGIDKGHFSSALPETMEAVLAHIGCGVVPCRGLHCDQSGSPQRSWR